MHCFAWAINYESGSFWVAVASLAVAVIVSVVSLRLSQVSVRISESSLNLTKELAERDLRDWTQRKWFDLYVAAERFRTLLERFQTIYERPLSTLEFQKDANDLTFAIRETLPYASVFPDNPTVDAFFNCIRKWKLNENLFSKEMLAEYIVAIEGFRQEAKVPEIVIQKTWQNGSPQAANERTPPRAHARGPDRPRMRNSSIILLIVSVGVLGLLLYLQTTALREQRRKAQELNAKLESMSKTANLDLQEKCAKQAREEFLGLGWGKHEGAVFGNHYNQKLNRCFVRFENTDASHPGRIFTFKTVSDAFEGKVYAHYTHFKFERSGSHTWEERLAECKVMLLSGEEKTCHSSEEFDALVKQYME